MQIAFRAAVLVVAVACLGVGEAFVAPVSMQRMLASMRIGEMSHWPNAWATLVHLLKFLLTERLVPQPLLTPPASITGRGTESALA